MGVTGVKEDEETATETDALSPGTLCEKARVRREVSAHDSVVVSAPLHVACEGGDVDRDTSNLLYQRLECACAIGF